jgi:hypothetical protein
MFIIGEGTFALIRIDGKKSSQTTLMIMEIGIKYV